MLRRMKLLSLFAIVAASAFILKAQESHKTENVIFVMTDGLRWEEVFHGAESDLISKRYGKVADVDKLRKKYWRDESADRRAALMPFLWNVVAKEGQIYGDRDKHSEAFVTNGLNFSYPGYSETLCGFADPKVKATIRFRIQTSPCSSGCIPSLRIAVA
jgi:hypothetical protein